MSNINKRKAAEFNKLDWKELERKKLKRKNRKHLGFQSDDLDAKRKMKIKFSLAGSDSNVAPNIK